MKTALLQLDIAWQDKEANRARIESIVMESALRDALILLPEMFTTGFCHHPQPVAETMDGETILWMQKLASQTRSALAGSLIIHDGHAYRNRLVFVPPTGQVQWYDKRHLFTIDGEETAYKSGNHRLVVTFEDWRICFQICYDLRFPVWSRNREDYDLLVYSANWPAARSEVWYTLLRARAIENQCIVAGVNRTGVDGNQIRYHGGSVVVDPRGAMVAEAGDNQTLLCSEINLNELQVFRNRFPAWKDRDEYTLTS